MSQCQLYKERRKELEKFYHEYGELFRVTLPDETGVLSLPSETLKDIQEKGEKLKKKIKELYRKFDIYEYAWKKFTEGGNVKLKEVLKISTYAVEGGRQYLCFGGKVSSHSFTDENCPLGAGLLVTTGEDDEYPCVKFIDLSDPNNIRLVRGVWEDTVKGRQWHRFNSNILSHSFTDEKFPLGAGLLVTTASDGAVKFADISEPDDIRVVQTVSEDTVKEGQWHSGKIYSHSFTGENYPLGAGLLVTTGEDGTVKFTDISDPNNIRVVQTVSEDTVKKGWWHSGEITSHSFTDEKFPLGAGLLVTTGADGTVKFTDISDPNNIRVVLNLSRFDIGGKDWYSGWITSHSFTDENHPLGAGLLITTGEDKGRIPNKIAGYTLYEDAPIIRFTDISDPNNIRVVRSVWENTLEEGQWHPYWDLISSHSFTDEKFPLGAGLLVTAGKDIRVYRPEIDEDNH